MTFIFEDIFSGEMRYVNASNLADALEIFDHNIESSDSDFEHVHVYVRIF